MGVNIGDLTTKRPTSLTSLSGKTIAIDTFNMLYQFLSSIRQPDGTPLKDFKGNITSHLTGLFYRTSRFLKNGIKPVYVFDGKPPKLKKATIEKRVQNRKDAEKKWKEALEDERYEDAKKYAQASSRLTEEMVDESKELLSGLGIPWIQAKSEGEAQSSVMAEKGIVYASASQDYDSLLFGTPILLRNLSITGRRKVPRQDRYILVEPERIFLKEMLEKNEISREQLIIIGILCGTDFNKGVRRVGPKTAIKLVKKHPTLNQIKNHVKEKYSHEFDVDPEEIISFFLNPPYEEVKEIKFQKPNLEKVKKILCADHDFSEQRVEKTLNDLTKVSEELFGQSKLDKWF